jgi:hypothetical protein
MEGKVGLRNENFEQDEITIPERKFWASSIEKLACYRCLHNFDFLPTQNINGVPGEVMCKSNSDSIAIVKAVRCSCLERAPM